MCLKNTAEKYGGVAKAFHWSMALIMMGLLLIGLYMVELDRTPFKFELYGWHKSFGIVILAMVIARMAWKFANPKPAPLETHQKWEKILAKLAHIFLYAGMIGMPLTGWLMSSAGGYPVKVFGLEIPALMGKDPDFGGLMNKTHRIFSYCLIAAIFLHAAGAFKHHFMDKDVTLKRMLAVPMQKVGPFVAAGVATIFALGVMYLFLLN